MFSIAIIILLCCSLYMGFKIISSLSDLTVLSKKLVELNMNSLKTKGGLYPVASQYDMMLLMEEKDEIWKRILGRGLTIPPPYRAPEFLSEYIKSGKGWSRLQREIEENFDDCCGWNTRI